MPTTDSSTVATPPEESAPDGQTCAVVRESRDGGELFIVDNGDSEPKGPKYLQDWTEIAGERTPGALLRGRTNEARA